MQNENMKSWFQKAVRIRNFENQLIELFKHGHVRGTVHTCIGQEFCALAVAGQLQPRDWVSSNHRGHGHYLAFAGNEEGLLCEILGRQGALCGGYGGSQHIHGKNFFSNGILGGMSAFATGVALANSLQQNNSLSVIFLGDGATTEGIVYEALNFAGLRKLPLLFVVENNGISQTTLQKDFLAGHFQGRAEAFGLKYFCGTTSSVESLFQTARQAIEFSRAQGPALLEVQCSRLSAHSKGDDTRDNNTISELLAADPLQQWLQYPENKKFQLQTQTELTNLCNEILARPCTKWVPPPQRKMNPLKWSPVNQLPAASLGQELNQCLHQLIEDPKLVVLGEDILDPYGGAFKVTRGLSTKAKNQVVTTPNSEALIAGMSLGLSWSGLIPIAEFMFGDFVFLAADQILNHVAKFRTMYNSWEKRPLILRLPVGGRRGYGPTHSQSPFKFFLGQTDLRVISMNGLLQAESVFRDLIAEGRPSLMFEPKALYGTSIPAETFAEFQVESSQEPIPNFLIKTSNEAPDFTLITHGYGLNICLDTMKNLKSQTDLQGQTLCFSQIDAVDLWPYLEVLSKCPLLIYVDEEFSYGNLGAEIFAQLSSSGNFLNARLLRIGAADSSLPTAFSMEESVLPNSTALEALIKNQFGIND